VCEISDLIFEANKETLKNLISKECEKYKEGHIINKVYENRKLTGVFIYQDKEDNKRILEEAHYMGNNKYIFLRAWRNTFDKTKHCLAKTTKGNDRMLKFLKKMKFKVYDMDNVNYFLEFRG